MKVSFNLEPDQLQRVKDVYTRLTTDVMMKRCLQGFTQNPNESFHSRIWLYSPKHLPTTKRKLEFAVAQATSEYNTGHLDSNIYLAMGLPLTTIVEKYLRRKDKKMDIPLKKKMRNRRLQKELDYEAGSY